jgi:tRNA(Ile2) C34 agmatinyltransferase TiaS
MRLFEPHGSTLEDVVLGAWEDLVAGDPAECPVCGGSMRGAGGCRSCGSDLS